MWSWLKGTPTEKKAPAPKNKLPDDLYIEGIDFEVIALKGIPELCIHILQGEYKGIVYRYINFKVDRSTKIVGMFAPKVEYQLSILKTNEKYKNIKDLINPQFDKFIRDILYVLVYDDSVKFAPKIEKTTNDKREPNPYAEQTDSEEFT